MAALPENYVSLQQLRESWLQSQRQDQGRRGDDRDRKPEFMSGKARGREDNGPRDIASRRREFHWSQNKEVGGGRKGPAAAVGRCAGGFESAHGKEVAESSRFVRDVVEGSSGKEVHGRECRPECSDRRVRGFERSGSGPIRAKEDEARRNGPRMSGRNEGSGGGGGLRRELAARAAECESLERPDPRRSESEVRFGARTLGIVPDRGSTVPERGSARIEAASFTSAVVEESAGKEAKSEVFQQKKGKSKKKSRKKKKGHTGALGAEHGSGGGNGRHPHFQRNEDGHRGDDGGGRSRGKVAVTVAEIVPLEQSGPSRLDSEVILGDKMLTTVPVGGLDSPPEKEHVESVYLISTLVEENSEKEMKTKEYERKRSDGCIRRRYDKERRKTDLGNTADYRHEAPAKTLEEGRGSEMKIAEDLTRGNNYRRKGGKKKEYGTAQIREKEDQVAELADGHNLPLEAVTLPGRKENVALRGKYSGLHGQINGRRTIYRPKENARINGRRVISGPKENGLSHRVRVVAGEVIEIQEDFSEDKETVHKEVEPAHRSSTTEEKLGDKQENDTSSKEIVVYSEGDEVTRKLRGFQIGSRGRSDRIQRRPPRWAEDRHRWRSGDSKRETWVSVSDLERDMVWVKKGDSVAGNNTYSVTRGY